MYRQVEKPVPVAMALTGLWMEEQEKISNKHWLLFDLRESTVKMEKNKK